jgi:2-hydroxy-3-oxopropionate reductase
LIVGYDIVKERVDSLAGFGAEAAASCKEVAERADNIITMVPYSPHVREVILGQQVVFEGVREGAVVIDMSTIDPETTRELARKLSSKGVQMLDAPVVKGVRGAVDGTLAILSG